MSSIHEYEPAHLTELTHRFGAFFWQRAQVILETYRTKWDLSQLELIPSFSANIVFTCDSAKYGPAVLKIGVDKSGLVLEYQALRAFESKGVCGVFEADLEEGVLLIQRISPGLSLREEQSLDKRLDMFCSAYSRLHHGPSATYTYGKENVAFPTYLSWITGVKAYMFTRDEWQPFYHHISRAYEIYDQVAQQYSRQLLLHGDFHHDNILLGDGGAYVVIDPKGVVGDPVFDVPRFLLNEFGDQIDHQLWVKLQRCFTLLEARLGIPALVLRQCLFVETVLAACWYVESGADEAKQHDLEQQIAFAHRCICDI